MELCSPVGVAATGDEREEPAAGGAAAITGGNSSIDAGNGALNIVRAMYGAGRQRRDVTDRVRPMVRHGRLSISVNNDVLGDDPASNVPKDLVRDTTTQPLSRIYKKGRQCHLVGIRWNLKDTACVFDRYARTPTNEAFPHIVFADPRGNCCGANSR